ncbi:MAG: YheT family hydrolase [Isosphaeraceae bacterium]
MSISSSQTGFVDSGYGNTGRPAFEPHPWLRSAHAQTIVGRYWPSRGARLESNAHEIVLADGDRLVLLDSVPAGWRSPHPTAVLVHGLAGCAEAPYMVRLGVRLLGLGIRVVRMNLRNAGAGFGRARGVYHAGRSEDLREVLAWLKDRDGMSPVALVGFSLGGNLVLKLAAEAAIDPAGVEALDCVLAANPPIDLTSCSRQMQRPENRLYDRNFVKWLRRMVRELHRRFPELGPTHIDCVKTVYEFDDHYTARRNGFASADDYYERCSLVAKLGQIAVPGLVVHAMDDPFIPQEPFEQVAWPPNLVLDMVRHGGHLGYLSRQPWQGIGRWLDARLDAWLDEHWGISGRKDVRLP